MWGSCLGTVPPTGSGFPPGRENATAYTELTALAYTRQFHELSSFTDPLGKMTTLEYDSSGNMPSAADPLGNQTAFTYDGKR
jgi:YD repeat-containing protein